MCIYERQHLELDNSKKSLTDCLNEILALTFMAEMANEEVSNLQRVVDTDNELGQKSRLSMYGRRQLELQPELTKWISTFLMSNIKALFKNDYTDLQLDGFERVLSLADQKARGEFLLKEWKHENIDMPLYTPSWVSDECNNG